MNADSLSLESWDEFASKRQLDSWQMPDSLAELDSLESDFTLGLPVSSPLNSLAWKPDPSSFLSDTEESDPFKRFQTPSPRRSSPTPLDDLYAQSMDQAEVNSSDWEAPIALSKQFEQKPVAVETAVQQPTKQESPAQESDVNQLRTDFIPADFDVSSFVPENDSDSNYLNSNVNIQGIPNPEEQLTANVPQLEQNSQDASKETKQKQTSKTPVLFYLGIAISICGIGLVFGAQILSKVTLINPGKAMIIAGVSGIMFSGISCFLGSLFHRAKA